jgi:hypothetical protein
MPSHWVEMKIPTTKVVQHADVVFEVFDDEGKLGELRISQGGVDWYPRGAQIPAKLSWEQFANVMHSRR